MTKEECQEKIANIICSKPDNMTCDECYMSVRSDICNEFNGCRISEKTKEQLEYVTVPIEENIFLRACAGSGKTEVLGLKAAYEMRQWKLYNQGIAVLTFTNDATNVIIDRVKQFTGKSNTYPHYIGTLSSFVHSYIVQPFTYKLRGYKGKDDDFSVHIIDCSMPIYKNHWLDKYSCDIFYMDSNGIWKAIYANQIGYDMEKKDFYFYIGHNKIKWLSEYYKSDQMQGFIRKKRKEIYNFWTWQYVQDCFQKCKEEFWKDGFATFDDLNYLAVEILCKRFGSIIAKRFPVIFIDECQDLSANELKVFQLLQKRGCHIHCVGDLNQSIYEFKRVEPNEINDFVHTYKEQKLSKNFRSCKQIVDFSEKLIDGTECKSANLESQFGKNALLYVEYQTPEDAIHIYYELLEKYNFLERENRVLVRQNSVRLQLEKSTRNDYDEKEPLIVASQLWKLGTPQQMKSALELAGKQISKWFGGGQSMHNYYCPKEINSVFQWRIYLLNVLKDILRSPNLSNYSLTYGKWHEFARKELGNILQNNYLYISDYDEIIDRDFNSLIDGRTYKVSKGNKDVVIGELDKEIQTTIPIMTIHSSKGCTFDSTLVISSKNAQSKGGHWKEHWLNGEGEAKRMGYVASTRAKHLLVWGVPKLKAGDRRLLEAYGFINGKKLLE